MSTVKALNYQVGQSLTATNNFTLYQPTSPDGTVRWGVGNSGSVTDIMTLNSSGNVGIGTTDMSVSGANAKFAVSGGVLNLDDSQAVAWGGGTGRTSINGSKSTGVMTLVTAPAATGGNINLVASDASSYIVLKTANTERMRLDSSGNLGLGVTPSAWVSGWKAVEVGALGAAVAGATANGSLHLLGNTINGSGGYVYAANGYAVRYAIAANAGSHVWYTAPSGTAGNAISFTQAMTLDASGNLKVGTTVAPNGKFIVNNGTNKNIQLRGSIRLAGSSIQSLQDDVTTDSPLEIYTGSAQIQIEGTPLTFLTSATERMRIDSSGGVFIGKTASSLGTTGAQFFQSGESYITRDGGACFYLNRLTSDGTIQLFYRSGTNVGAINVTTTSTAYVTSSDYRLKENIQPMQNALGVVAQLNPVTYTWKADGSDGQGFIAHELQAVVPDCVSGDKDAEDEDGNPVYQGIDTSFLVATLTAAIQEQQAIIESLTKRIETLEGA